MIIRTADQSDQIDPHNSAEESRIISELADWTLDDYSAGTARCPYCNRSHSPAIRYIDICADALNGLARRLDELGVRKPYVVADINTDRAAGEQTREALAAGGVQFIYHILSGDEPVPDEAAVGDLLMGFDSSCDFILGVGSGVINDLCRFVSFQTGRRFGIIASAPSMDGFASTVAPLIRRSLKTTFIAHPPALIIGDTNILSRAPRRLIAAGYADVVGKLNSLIDWKIARLTVGEYYCPWVAAVMRLALERTLACADGLARGDAEASRRLMEALTMAGLAMTYAGYSRPASGFEHHLAHAWEMSFLRLGRKLIPHGVKVGLGTIAAAKLAKRIRSASVDWDESARAPARLSVEAWEDEMRRVFGAAAPDIISLERSVQKNSPEKRATRLNAAREHWDEIRLLLAALPSGEQVVQTLRAVGSPVNPREIELPREAVRDGILYAKEVRDRYTQQQLAWDIGGLPGWAEEITEELFNI